MTVDYTYKDIAKMIDHSLLNPTIPQDQLEDGCALALEYDAASVCILPYYLKRCAVCFLKGLCEQCPAKSWMENGSLDTPVEYLCRIAHAQARHLGILEENENAWNVHNWKNRVKSLSQRPS